MKKVEADKAKTDPSVQGGYQVIFRAWYLDKDGNKVRERLREKSLAAEDPQEVAS